MVACYGTTEYPENMTPVRLYANGGEQNHELSYAYKCRDCCVESPDSVKAVVPPIKTRVTLTVQGRERTDYRTHSVAVAFTGSARTGAANGLFALAEVLFFALGMAYYLFPQIGMASVSTRSIYTTSIWLFVGLLPRSATAAAVQTVDWGGFLLLLPKSVPLLAGTLLLSPPGTFFRRR